MKVRLLTYFVVIALMFLMAIDTGLAATKTSKDILKEGLLGAGQARSQAR